jgi:ribonuclease HI
LRNTTYIVPAEGALTVFTDGACLPTPRRGGIGIRFVHSDHLGNETIWDFEEPGYAGATSNQMELQAVITAMKAIEDRRVPADLLEDVTKIDIYTDSLYVTDNLNKAIFEWPQSGWMTRNGPPVLNAHLWKVLVRRYTKLKKAARVEIKWGKGHSANNPHNKAADKLAKQSAKRPLRPSPVAVAVRRKQTRELLDTGSVQMLGQRLTIRIITAEYLRVPTGHRYRSEVRSRTSPYRGKVDIAYSTNGMMRAGHTYYVTMNNDPSYPKIVKCHRDVVEANAASPTPA